MSVGWNFCPYRAYIATIVTALYTVDLGLYMYVVFLKARQLFPGKDL